MSDVTAKLDAMSKDERSTLLYLETRAVDQGGLVAPEKMNAEDFAMARRWAKSGFIRFSRVPTHLLPDAYRCTHVVELTDESWACAAMERRRRAERSQREVVRPSLEHFGQTPAPASPVASDPE